jgi:hypothetical protein
MRNDAAESARRLSALAAMVLTLGFAGVGDVVLCVGDDGHLAIEAVGPEGCAEVVERAASGRSALALRASSSHCGPCVDVTLSSASATESIKAAKPLTSAASAASTSELQPPVPHLRASVAYRHNRRFISEKPYTVVIRC